MRRLVPLVALALALACGGRGGRHERLHVYAAASLRDAVTELAALHEARGGPEWILNFGPSNRLATQIEFGGHADVFLSAGEEEMDRLARADRVLEGTRRTLLSNTLVVVVPAGARRPASLDELASSWIEHLSIANPDGVPAGRYARASLERAGLWEQLAPRVLPGADVRAALAAVESGGAEAGIVYRTDAALTGRVDVALDVPAAVAPSIAYPVAALSGRHREALARDVLAFLAGADARAVFERHGFVVVGEEAR